jgi:putative oxidoreductase
MFQRLIKTNNDVALGVARLVVGIVFFAHGAQKVLGWFGGYGFSGTMGAFTTRMGIPAPLAFLAIMAEFLGGLGLIVGFLSRIAAFGIFMNILVAVLLVHRHFGLFANWYGNQAGEGFEYHLLAMPLMMLIMFKGSGAFSVDGALSRSESPVSAAGRSRA